MSRQEFKWFLIVFGLAIAICWLDYYWQKNRPDRSPKLVDPSGKTDPSGKGHHIWVNHRPEQEKPVEFEFTRPIGGVYHTRIHIKDAAEYEKASQRVFDLILDHPIPSP